MRLKKEGSCINIENEVDAWSRKTGAHASLFRKRPAGRVPPNLPETHPTPKAWCLATKEQGLAGSGAPRPTCRRPIRPQRRGAPQRRNKGLRGAEHHAQLAGGPSDPKDVVPRDEETRVSGERSTTPNLPEIHPTLETWCPATKKQGFAGSEAPRPTCRRPIRPQRRGAPRRRNKG